MNSFAPKMTGNMWFRAVSLLPVVSALLADLRGHTGGVFSLSFSADSTMLASAGFDKTVRLWNVSSLSASSPPVDPRILGGHRVAVTSVAFSKDGDKVVTGSGDNSSIVWDVSSGKRFAVMRHPGTVHGVAFNPENNTELATACSDGTIRIFDNRAVLAKELVGHNDGVYALAYSPDGKFLVSVSKDRSVRIWNLTHDEVAILDGHRDDVVSVATTDNAVVSGSWDRSARIWRRGDVDQGETAWKLGRVIKSQDNKLVFGVAFMEGDRVVICSGSMKKSPVVNVYDLETGTPLRTLQRHKDTPLSVALAPNTMMMATAGWDSRVLVYDAFSNTDDTGETPEDEEEPHKQKKAKLPDAYSKFTNFEGTHAVL